MTYLHVRYNVPVELTVWRPRPIVAMWRYSYKASCASLPDRDKPSFVIFDIWALWRQSARMLKITNDDLTRSRT